MRFPAKLNECLLEHHTPFWTVRETDPTRAEVAKSYHVIIVCAEKASSGVNVYIRAARGCRCSVDLLSLESGNLFDSAITA